MKIQDLLSQSKPCWKYAAMDKGKNWTLFERKPNLIKKRHRWERRNENHRLLNLSYVFDIEPFDGDWKDSLIEREEWQKDVELNVPKYVGFGIDTTKTAI